MWSWSGGGAGPGRLVRWGAILSVDGLVAALALFAAMALRFESRVPQSYREALAVAVPLLVGIRLACNVTAHLHGWSFRMAGLSEAVRVGAAGLAGSAVFMELCPWLVPGGLPQSIYALEFFLTTTLSGAIRFGPRVGLRWWCERARHRAGAARTLIVGVDAAAELLARDVMRAAESRYRLVGFVGSDPHMVGCRLDGKPVLGTVRDLPELIRRHAVTMVLLTSPSESGASVREVLDTCATCRVRFKIVPASFMELEERISAAMLKDLAPEDLLTRKAVAFDEGEISSRVRGRRALVTGAGGSIGGEICRQLARLGAKALVMVDMNENELYLRTRSLTAEFPGVLIRAEVADVRERARLERLGARFAPEYVFHSAAHKHVPLMEEAPEEAVKNNVFGTLNAARMADACGAERFVLISTDKAVNPTSVMGATKRVAEIVVRHLARRSRTRMTSVRFGNVLGSAGSIVPIFKQQIERGGPVTVTHPGCVRFFMTVQEAVGLVLMAGLGDYGDLCVLDMGEPLHVADLARNMITLSGKLPGVEIPIVYSGLRPGEKLFEELLTEEEEQSHVVRDRIWIARCPPPPPDLDARLADLWHLAHSDRLEGLLEALRGLVPTYRATPGALARTQAALVEGDRGAEPEGGAHPAGEQEVLSRPREAAV